MRPVTAKKSFTMRYFVGEKEFYASTTCPVQQEDSSF